MFTFPLPLSRGLSALNLKGNNKGIVTRPLTAVHFENDDIIIISDTTKIQNIVIRPLTTVDFENDGITTIKIKSL